MTLPIAIQVIFIVVTAVLPVHAAIIEANETNLIPCPPSVRELVSPLQSPPNATTRVSVAVTYRQFLNLTDSRGFDRTIAFTDGSASDIVTYELKLPLDEFITSLRHIPNDTSIITESNAAYVTHKLDGYRLENITLRHEFEGLVGPANYTLTLITNKGHTFMATGRYYITGVIGFRKNANRSQTAVSGISAPAITFESPNDVTLKHKNGIVEVPIKYQKPGPDVTKNPPSLAEVMAKSQVQVTGRSIASKTNLVSQACKKITQAFQRPNGVYKFLDENCGVGFHRKSGKLLVRLKFRETGYAGIFVTTPPLDPSGEASEASFRFIVKKPLTVQPILVMKQRLNMKLDHFGREIFTLNMKKTREPYQKHNATDYVVDLPGNRYARADMNLSTMNKGEQIITFVTVIPGQESEAVRKNLKNVLKNARRAVVPSPEADSSPQATPDGIVLGRRSARYEVNERRRSVWDLPVDLGFGLNFGMKMKRDAEMSPAPSVEIMDGPDTSGEYGSNVHVMIPPVKSYQTANNVNKKPLLTEFAPDMLAQITTAEKDPRKTYVSVSLVLYNYTTETFSDHKSQQLGSTLADIVSKESKTSTSAELVRKRKRRSDIIVTYRIFTAKKSSQIAGNMTKIDSGVAAEIAENSMMRKGTVAVFDAMVLPGFGDPNFNGAAGEGASLSGSTVGLIVAAIVALTLIIMIPLFVFCFGYIVTRRHAQAADQGAGAGTNADYGSVTD